MSQLIVTLLASYGLCFGLMTDQAAWFTRLLRRIPGGADAAPYVRDDGYPKAAERYGKR